MVNVKATLQLYYVLLCITQILFHTDCHLSYIYIYIYSFIHSLIYFIYLCMYVCLYVCIYLDLHTYIHICQWHILVSLCFALQSCFQLLWSRQVHRIKVRRREQRPCEYNL